MWQRATAPLLPAYPAHTTSHKHTHTHTQHASPTRRSHNTAYGDRLPLILSSAALTWTSLYPLSITTTIRTHTHAHRHKPPFAPARPLFSFLLSFSRPLFIPPVALQNLQTSLHCHYSLLNSIHVHSSPPPFVRRIVLKTEPPPPLTTSASPPSPPPTSASPPSPPPPP